MPRDLALGNGHLLVTFDAAYTMRDFYYPHVGKENHTIGHPSRVGVWADGRFAWFSDPGWSRTVRYKPNSLVSDVTLEHPGLGLRIHATDAVHPERPILLRAFEVTNLESRTREVRMLFHQDFHISESEIGDTAAYEPVNRSMGHYKGCRYFVINGRTGDGQGIFQYTTGIKETGRFRGTWCDAEDGWLEMNPIAQGSVDSTISFRQNIGGGSVGRFYFWIGAEKDYWDARELNLLVLNRHRRRSPADADKEQLAVGQMIEETNTHWRNWISRAPEEFADLPDPVQELFRRSLLVIASQIDHGGAIIAANDGDATQFNRDTYSYMWPRDGALVARTLDCCGYTDLSERFFRFCARLMPRDSYYPEGYLMHKFNADGSLGSSWHPWVRDGRPSLPIQEDETALVLWALWRHFLQRRATDKSVYDLVRELTPSLILPAARFLLLYRDEPEGRKRFELSYSHPPTGLPLASYDLWEERYGIHAFTVASLCAGLGAAGELLDLMAQQNKEPRKMPEAEIAASGDSAPPFHAHELGELAQRCKASSSRMRDAFQQLFWSTERKSYARMLNFTPDGNARLDTTLDASTLYAMLAFGVFDPADPKVQDTIRSVEERLWCKTSIGGMARYENDPYYRQSDDVERVPGNPWFVCTLWGAMGRIFLARQSDDLKRPREILHWACVHARPSGVLAEQAHPYTGAPMSVAPLTWSHSTFVETVLAYCKKYGELK